MKWLIIFLLISCGKDHEPSSFDIGDNDGDQIINSKEKTGEENIANITKIGVIKGTISFSTDKLHEISFSNEHNIRKKTFELLLKRESKIKKEDHFNEWSQISIKENDTFSLLTKKQYTINLKFDSTSDRANEIFLNNKKVTNWNELITLNISQEDLLSILKGETFFHLKKNIKNKYYQETSNEESIRKNTYKVYYSDKTKSEILYIANTLPFNLLLSQLGINAGQEINDDYLFFNRHLTKDPQWYTRELVNGDKVIIFSDAASIESELSNKYEFKKTTILRKNGLSTSKLILQNSNDANVYLRIKSPNQILRTFIEDTQTRRHGRSGGGGVNRDGGDFYNCIHYLRKIHNSQLATLSYYDLAANLSITSNGQTIHHSLIFTDDVNEIATSTGLSWELKLKNNLENIAIELPSRPTSTFTTTGEYHNSCGGLANRGTDPSYHTNNEEEFSLEVETFVEKL